MENLCTVIRKKWLGADCGSDPELLIAKFRLKLKAGKIARSLKYDLNQIPYDYTVKATNTYKGLDLIVYLSNYGRGPHEVLTKTIPKKKKNESLRNP